jgi:hypothetical protein
LAGSYFDSGRQGDTLELALRGDWRAATLVAIRDEQSRLDLDGVRRVLLRAPGPLDLGGAWALDELTRELAARDIQVEFPDGEPRTLVLVRSALARTPANGRWRCAPIPGTTPWSGWAARHWSACRRFTGAWPSWARPR